MRRKKFSQTRKSTQPENRINSRIHAPQVRVIGPEGEQLGVIPTREAIGKAQELGIDLVEVAPNADPPVCKLMDYGKFRYQQQKRAHEAKKKQTVIQIKEVKVRPKIDEHDYQFKLNHVKRFLDNGDKAKISVVFRGREIVHRDLGRKLLDRFIEETKDIADVEMMPKMEGRAMTMIMTTKSPKGEKRSKESEQEKRDTNYAKDENE